MAGSPGFSEFVAARSHSLLRTAYLLTGNWASAEDLLQTTLASCWRSWGRLSDSPEAYVHAAMVNTYVSWRRRRWSGEESRSELPDGLESDATRMIDDRDVLWQALRRLPRRQRAVVVLRYYEDLSELETARILGIGTGTVKSHASRALATLRRDAGLLDDRSSDDEEVAHAHD